MKHWLGVLLIALVMAGIGLLVPGDTGAGESIRGGLLGGGFLIGVIAALKIAAELMRSDSKQS